MQLQCYINVRQSEGHVIRKNTLLDFSLLWLISTFTFSESIYPLYFAWSWLILVHSVCLVLCRHADSPLMTSTSSSSSQSASIFSNESNKLSWLPLSVKKVCRNPTMSWSIRNLSGRAETRNRNSSFPWSGRTESSSACKHISPHWMIHPYGCVLLSSFIASIIRIVLQSLKMVLVIKIWLFYWAHEMDV